MDINKRIEWIDISKGLGMLLVIAGHTIALKYSSILYTFHMPLFFFLSGLVAKEYSCLGDVFKNKTRSILIPWGIMLFISFLVVLLIPEWRNQLNFSGIIEDFYSANTNLFQNSSLWYLMCFFWITIMFYPLSKHVEKPISKNKIIIFAIIAYLLLYSRNLLLIIPLPEHRLPFKMDTALIGLVFYAVGYYSKAIVIKIVADANYKWVVLLAFLCFVLSFFNGWTNLNGLFFGKIRALFYPIAFIGIFTCLFASSLIEKMGGIRIKKILVFYGRNSLLIFGFQSLLIRLYLLTFNQLEGLNMQLYANNPIVHQIGSFVAVSFIGSPLVVLLFKFLREKSIRIL